MAKGGGDRETDRVQSPWVLVLTQKADLFPSRLRWGGEVGPPTPRSPRSKRKSQEVRVDGACSQPGVWPGLGPFLSEAPKLPDHPLRAQSGPSGRLNLQEFLESSEPKFWIKVEIFLALRASHSKCKGLGWSGEAVTRGWGQGLLWDGGHGEVPSLDSVQPSVSPPCPSVAFLFSGFKLRAEGAGV